MASVRQLIGLGIPAQVARKLGYKSSGSITANGTTEVTVSNTALGATDKIILTTTTVGGTPSAMYVFSRTAGTGFSVKAGASDTGVWRYEIYEV